MITQLATLKARLSIDEFEVKYDTMLTNSIRALSAQFDKQTGRTLARTLGIKQEFNAVETELCLTCIPLEVVTMFELKSNETDDWSEQPGVEYLVRAGCVLSLAAPLGGWRQQARVTYTGGHALPGTTVGAGQTPLPDDLEQAAVEQAAYWFRNRDTLGLVRHPPFQGTYDQFAQLDLLLSVRTVLDGYRRLVT